MKFYWTASQPASHNVAEIELSYDYGYHYEFVFPPFHNRKINDLTWCIYMKLYRNVASG